MVFSYRSLGHIEASPSTNEPMNPSEGCREFIELLAFVRRDVLSDLLKDDEKCHKYAK
jgi:hypothetical protein